MRHCGPFPGVGRSGPQTHRSEPQEAVGNEGGHVEGQAARLERRGGGVVGEAHDLAPAVHAWMTPEGADWRWESLADYLSALETRGLPLNVAALVPHGLLYFCSASREKATSHVDPSPSVRGASCTSSTNVPSVVKTWMRLLGRSHT